MKRSLVIVFTFLALLFVPMTQVQATSAQAYQDYLFQFDSYRQKLSEFKVAKNEYEKFRSLTSETTALEKTKLMLAQRDQLLRAYLFLLNEKLNEDKGLRATEKSLYQTLINNEVKFLDAHTALIPSIGSLDDATEVSEQLESHYDVLQVSIRQILTGIALGQLATLHVEYDRTLSVGQQVVGMYGGTFDPGKQSILNRWLLQIGNKRSLYQQKIDAITGSASQLSKMNEQELDRKFNELLQGAAEARQYLAEGASFMGELITALKYKQ